MTTGARLTRRDLALRWALPLVVVLLVVAVTAAIGGFREARADAGRPAAAGQPIDLARWEITVREAELVDTTLYDSPSSTSIRVDLTVTLTGDESESSLPTGLVQVVLPDGSTTEPPYHVDLRWSAGLDPHITRDYTLELVYPPRDDDLVQPALGTAPTTVSVVVRDEEYAEGALFGWSWGTAEVAAVVELPLADNRTAP